SLSKSISAASKNGTNKEFKIYPGCSLYNGKGTIPIAFANSITSLKYFTSVPGCFIISAVLFFQISLAKCRAKNFSGRPVASANWLGNKVEEFVAKTVFAGATFPNSL